MNETNHINWHTVAGMASKYLAEYDLPENSDLACKIVTIGPEIITGQGGTKEEKIVAHFEGIEKPMIVNKTNMRNLSQALGTDYLDEMAKSDKHIQLYRDQVNAGGALVKCIRIRPFPAAV